jgi:uncharacterized protein YcnI
VWPKKSTTGGHERYVVRVPNEKNVPTTRVEIRFPADLRVTAFAEVAGWQLEVLSDSAGRVIGAVWTGSLAPKRFIEFPFVAANPKAATKMEWPVFQNYGAERVEWTGPVGSKTPASVTEIAAAPAAVAAKDSTAGAATASAGGGTSSTALYLAGGALLLALVSLGLGLRRAEPARA